MPIGNGPDIEQFNRKEEDQIRLQEKVNNWFWSLDANFQRELVEDYYPDHSHLMSICEMWDGLDWNDKWDIYSSEKDEAVDV